MRGQISPVQQRQRSGEAMFLYNSLYKEYPVAIHAPGFVKGKWSVQNTADNLHINTRLNPLWSRFYRQWQEQEACEVIPAEDRFCDFTVLTCNTTGEGSLLEDSLKRLGIPCLTLGKEVENWRNVMKIDLLRDSLQSVFTRYSFVFDSFDVLVLRHLSHAVSMFQQHQCRMLLNCEGNFWPHFGERYFTGALRDSERRLAGGPRPFLNSGMLVAETSFLREILDELASLDLHAIYDHNLLPRRDDDFEHQKAFDSDQLLYHLMYVKYYPAIKLDHWLHIFFNMVGAKSLPYPLVHLTSSTLLNYVLERKNILRDMRLRRSGTNQALC